MAARTKKATTGKAGVAAEDIRRRAARVRVVLMDVDGVMTDGRICLMSLSDGTTEEMKMFHAHDGAGIKLAGLMGLRTGLITGRNCAATARRARESGMEFVFQGRPKKLAAYEEILQAAGVADEVVAYIGDDLPDLPLLRRAGLAVAVANAVPEVKKAAHYVTALAGGQGAVREVIELVLKAQGRWNEAIPRAMA
jgi:3-deoxy-D-manno-octulosonate 8-phosphate phosphatase (KDO 8-P phosphatase)